MLLKISLRQKLILLITNLPQIDCDKRCTEYVLNRLHRQGTCRIMNHGNINSWSLVKKAPEIYAMSLV